MKPGKTSSIKILDENDKVTSDSQKISNIFNEHYATLGAKVQQKIPTQEGDFKFYLDKRNKDGKRFINPEGCTFYLSPAGPAEVDKLIDELNLKKSTGPFGIPVFLLKKFKTFFSLWLSELVNLSFETGLFPDVLKIAKVNPLHKKESKLDHRNYRQISLLNFNFHFFCKLTIPFRDIIFTIYRNCYKKTKYFLHYIQANKNIREISTSFIRKKKRT